MAPEIISAALTAGTLIISPLASEIGKSIADVWHSTIGLRGRLLRGKTDILEKAILEKLAKIPAEKLIQPKLYMTANLLEAATFAVEEPVLANMFAGLLASSMNADKQGEVHPAFIEILKQLSPLDAKTLQNFAGMQVIAAVNYDFFPNIASGGRISMHKNITSLIIENANEMDIAKSVENLSRLGLVDIDFSLKLIAPDIYDWCESTPSYLELLNASSDGSGKLGTEKGSIKSTAFGKEFCVACDVVPIYT
jgi:hypothetical protein